MMGYNVNANYPKHSKRGRGNQRRRGHRGGGARKTSTGRGGRQSSRAGVGFKSRKGNRLKDPEDKRDFHGFEPSGKSVTPEYMGETTAPHVFFHPDVHDKMVDLVDLVEVEVGWIGILKEVKDNVFYVPEIFVIEQDVNMVNTTLDSEALGQLANQLINEDRTEAVGELLFWGHSHHTMPTSPSKTDQETVYDVFGDTSHCLRGIYNKDGDANLDFFDFDQELIFRDVDWEVRSLEADEADTRSALHEEIEEKVNYSYASGKKRGSSAYGWASNYAGGQTTGGRSSGQRGGQTKRFRQKDASGGSGQQGQDQQEQGQQHLFDSEEELKEAYTDFYLKSIPSRAERRAAMWPTRVERWISAIQKSRGGNMPASLKEIYVLVEEAQDRMIPPPGAESGIKIPHDDVETFIQENGRLPITWTELYGQPQKPGSEDEVMELSGEVEVVDASDA